MQSKNRHRLAVLIGFTLAIVGLAANADQTCSFSTSGLTCTPAGKTVACGVLPNGQIICADKPDLLHLVDTGSQSKSALSVTNLAKQPGFTIVPQGGSLQGEHEFMNVGLMYQSYGPNVAYRVFGKERNSANSLAYAEISGKVSSAPG